MTPRWIWLAGVVAVATAAPGRAPAAQAASDVPPRAVVREALRAVEGDSVAAARARLEARLRAAPGDRAAALGLASLARFTYDYPEAERRYAALYDTLAVGGPLAPAADAVARYALLGAASSLYMRGEDARSVPLFMRVRAAAHAAGDRALEVQTLGPLAMKRGAARGVPAGLALLDTADRLVPPGDAALAASLAWRRVIFLAFLSDRRASTEGTRALALARRAADRRAEAQVWRALAVYHHLRADDDSALIAYAAAEPLMRASGDRGVLAETLIKHADIYRERNDYTRARALATQAVAEAEASHSLYALAVAHDVLGGLERVFGNLAAADAHYEESVRRSEALRDSNTLIDVRVSQANLAVERGDVARARRYALAVRAFHHRTADAHDEFVALRTLAAVERRAGNYAAALAWIDTARALADGPERRAWRLELDRDRAAVAFARGDLPQARQLITRVLAVPDTSDRVTRYRMREQLAEVDARTGDLAGAERELTAAGAELDAWRATLSDRQMRALAFQARGDIVGETGNSAPAVLAALAAHGREAAAFELAERRRARTLADELTRTAALAETSVAGRRAAGGAMVARAGSALPAAAALVADGRTALLEFVAGDGATPTTLFVVTRGTGAGPTVRAARLAPADSLARRVARFTALLEAGGDPGPLARALGDAVLAPALAGLDPGVQRLVVVPDGPLHLLPFDALRTADGRYAVERYAVSVAPSAVVVAALRGRPAPPPRPVRLLAFGDPAFAPAGGAPAAGAPAGRAPVAGAAAARARDADDGGATFRSAFDSTGGLPRLAASGDEARDVARYAPDAVVRVGDEATAAYLKHAALMPYDVIHFATHALVDDRSIARTSLALAPGDGESGFVSAGDLAALHLTARVVVLSACRSAGGIVVDGEGVQGLTAPLLEAGAQSVVATQWRIRDRGTAAFVDRFYDHLARGLTVGDALRAAKRDAIARGAPPAEWAAFTVVGDPAVRVPLRTPGAPARWPLLAAGGATLLAVGGLARARRRPAA